MEGSNRAILRRFVVFEGLDGAGTTTQLRILENSLKKRGVAHWLSAEPTDLPTGRLIRQILRGEVKTRPETLARLYAADRHEHLYGPDGIVERLGRGELVVCDRYIFSSLAYQGVSCDPELPRLLNAAFPLPELLIFFDLPSSVSMGRVSKRQSEREIFETEDFQERVRKAYEESIAEFEGSGMRILRVDASMSVEAVTGQIALALTSLLGLSAL
jgi:dTMP kinase